MFVDRLCIKDLFSRKFIAETVRENRIVFYIEVPKNQSFGQKVKNERYGPEKENWCLTSRN